MMRDDAECGEEEGELHDLDANVEDLNECFSLAVAPIVELRSSFRDRGGPVLCWLAFLNSLRQN